MSKYNNSQKTNFDSKNFPEGHIDFVSYPIVHSVKNKNNSENLSSEEALDFIGYTEKNTRKITDTTVSSEVGIMGADGENESYSDI